MSPAAPLEDQLAAAAAAAREHEEPGERLTGVVAAEPVSGERLFLCSYELDGARSWLALDTAGAAVADRSLVREAISIAAMCEIAGETAGGGDLDELRAQLLQLRLTEAPLGIEDAEAAALALEQEIGAPPFVASAAYLDRIGAAARRLEQALGGTGASAFAAAMQQALASVEELAADVEAGYKRPLE